MEQIRQIATSYSGNLVALGAFTKDVEILDIESGKVVSAFETILDFGGARMTISNDGKTCICGCWERYGIAAYDTKTGKVLWQRKDLKKVQRMKILLGDRVLFAQFEKGASRLLDINTGQDVKKLNGVGYYFESQFLPIRAYGNYANLRLFQEGNTKPFAKMPINSWCILDVAFSPDAILISACEGPTSCYNIGGDTRWSIAVEGDERFLSLVYNEKLAMFICVTRPNGREANRKLCYINPDNGSVEKELLYSGQIECKFALKGQVLVSSSNEIININTGQVTGWI